VAFLTGGIGITPVISILEYIKDKGLDIDSVLFYSNRNEEDIAFRKELDSWSAAELKIKKFYFLTDCQPKDKTCIYGRITEQYLKDKVSDWQQRTVFIYGPPKMVEAMSLLCLNAGCDKSLVKSENFIGY
jgi:ferredoxin-NADP reductase